MKAFAYVNPTTEQDAIAALRTGGIVRPLAGGQDLLARIKDYLDEPDQLVNVKNALDATIADTPDGGLRLGAAVKIADLAEHAQTGRLYPPVALAASPGRISADPPSGDHRREPESATALLVLPQ